MKMGRFSRMGPIAEGLIRHQRPGRKSSWLSTSVHTFANLCSFSLSPCSNLDVFASEHLWWQLYSQASLKLCPYVLQGDAWISILSLSEVAHNLLCISFCVASQVVNLLFWWHVCIVDHCSKGAFPRVEKGHISCEYLRVPLWKTLPFQACSQFLIDRYKFFYRPKRQCEGVHWAGVIEGRIPGLTISWDVPIGWRLGDVFGVCSSLIRGVRKCEISSFPLKHSSKG